MSNETKTKVVYEKIDWKEAEVGAGWKKKRDGKDDYYFVKLNLSRWGVQKEVVLKGFQNKGQVGNNPPTMRLYWLGEETQLISASQAKQQQPAKETKPVVVPPKPQEEVAEKSEVDF